MRIALVSLCLVATACSSSEPPADHADETPVNIDAADPAVKAVPEKPIAYQVEACKAAIAVMMGREPRTMKGSIVNGNLAHVSYIRPDDGKRWQARCRPVAPGQIEWAAFDAFGDGQQGRWRTEEPISFTVEGKSLTVTINGSETGTYKLSTLK